MTVAPDLDRPQPLRPQRSTDEAAVDSILTPEALEFVRTLHGRFAVRRVELLADRRLRRRLLQDGGTLDFLPETAWIRDDPTWQVAPPAPGLTNRRVEITGPTDRKMTINALNSGADIWMADFEDSNSPTWSNIINGHVNLRDAIDRRIELTSDAGRRYVLGDDLATIVVRPRGLHLVDKHILLDGNPISASVLDFGLYLFHCARRQLDAGCGPYFYLPKIEHHLEARWWNDLFLTAQDLLGLAPGTIRATVLIETITASFQMEEILYELREHSSGLNAGRWDYIFSVLKNFGDRPEFILPDRASISMTVPFMRSYAELLVSTAHRRGAHAIGGMAASIPSRDPAANEVAFERVAADKQREAAAGFDGSWVAHPGLVPTCRDAFDAVLGDHPNQIERQVATEVTGRDLLDIVSTPGLITEAGLRQNIAVSLRYIASWLDGVGACAIDNLMEDAATAEISRSQVRQWLQHEVQLTDGRAVTPALVDAQLDAEFDALARVSPTPGATRRLTQARDLLVELLFDESPPDFFTCGAYRDHLVDRPRVMR